MLVTVMRDVRVERRATAGTSYVSRRSAHYATNTVATAGHILARMELLNMSLLGVTGSVALRGGSTGPCASSGR